MGMPLSELGERMSGEEFGWHWAQYRKHPWGEEADELYAAQVSHTVASMSGRTLKNDVELKHYLLFNSPEPVEEDPLEWARRHGQG